VTFLLIHHVVSATKLKYHIVIEQALSQLLYSMIDQR